MRAVEIAAQVTTAVQDTLIPGETVLKKDRSPVTIADLCSQAVVIRVRLCVAIVVPLPSILLNMKLMKVQELAAAFPHDPIVAEESRKTLGGSPKLQRKARC